MSAYMEEEVLCCRMEVEQELTKTCYLGKYHSTDSYDVEALIILATVLCIKSPLESKGCVV